jgi:hypothetical protein
MCAHQGRVKCPCTMDTSCVRTKDMSTDRDMSNDRDMSKMSGHVKCPCTKDASCVRTKICQLFACALKP